MELTGHSGDFVYLSARNNQEYGDVTCTIPVNGTVMQTVTSSGAYVMVSCSGTRPVIAGQYPGLKDLINGVSRQADSGVDYLE
jgi:hypothetical protein